MAERAAAIHAKKAAEKWNRPWGCKQCILLDGVGCGVCGMVCEVLSTRTHSKRLTLIFGPCLASTLQPWRFSKRQGL